MLKFLRKPMSLTLFSAIMSLVNLVFYNIPFFRFVAENSNTEAFDKVVFMACLVVVMLILNFMVCYLLIYLLRYAGRVLIALCHVLSATCVYFIYTYRTMMDATMLGNVFNTRYSEASGFMTWQLFAFIFIFGVLPAIYVLVQKISYGTLKRLGVAVAGSLTATIALILMNLNQVLWIGKYDTELGGLIMPYSYLVNTVRIYDKKRSANKEEIKLPDASFKNEEKEAVVLVIGESARKANFQLYGYGRATNPRLAARTDLAVFDANSNDTYTTQGVKAILEYKATSDLYEILPNYLFRAGADVQWRTANWGEPPVHIDEYYNKKKLAEIYPGVNRKYDEILFTGVAQRIAASQKTKVLVVLHTNTNHGPEYSSKYPSEFEIFKPVCTNVENAKDSIPELINAYDNSVVYTDYLVNNLIDSLSTLEDWKCAMIYVSDHGESLGENKLFMHGVPMKIAPKEQYEIPFIVWTSPDYRKAKQMSETIDQHYVFHSVLDLLSVESPVFDKTHSLFK
ncbi:MAG: phosphoethanolamine--lipid A transferase EptA [Bacteroidales bacterium]|nr:phosphoethanolamine--lipid A transferase EptA [Bacteroidales bacterium]